jgi:hypothetical protein
MNYTINVSDGVEAISKIHEITTDYFRTLKKRRFKLGSPTREEREIIV